MNTDRPGTTRHPERKTDRSDQVWTETLYRITAVTENGKWWKLKSTEPKCTTYIAKRKWEFAEKLEKWKEEKHNKMNKTMYTVLYRYGQTMAILTCF